MVKERDKLIDDAAKRFGLLKDDFQYNFSLLQARDSEIARLNTVENTLKSELEESDAEKIALSNRLNDILRKEVDRSKKHKQDKEKTKQMLSELQEELESLRWSTADEIGCRSREIESLKKDLRRSHAERDEALETQRIELVHTYDKLLQTREKEFADQEKYIADQVQGLEQRFHHLTADNSRLKSELATAHRDLEKAAVMAASNEERCMELEWRLSDLDKDHRDTEEELHRKLQAAQSDLVMTQQELAQLKNDYKREIEKVRAEQKRDKEYAALQLRHLSESAHKSAEDVEQLRTQLEDSENRLVLSKREVDMWKDKAMKSAANESQVSERLQVTQETLQSALRKTEEERDNLRGQLQVVQLEKTQLATDLQLSESTLKDVKEQSAEKLMRARDQLLEVTERYEQLRRSDTENARMEAEAHFIASQTEADAVLHSEIDSLRHRLEEKEATIETLRRDLALTSKELDDEKMESDALKLRLRLHGAANDGGTRGALPVGGGQFANGRTMAQFQQQMAPSPMFSEDMGPVSIPASPATSPTKHAVIPRRGGPTGSNEFNFKFGDGTDSPDSSRLGPGGVGGVAMLEPTDMENKRLKQVIKEMRKDAEEFHSEMQRMQDERDSAMARAGEMEDRLHVATAEVNRLRQERRRLMDVSNELRAIIHKLRAEDSATTAVDPPPTTDDYGRDVNRPSRERDNKEPEADDENSSRNTQSFPLPPGRGGGTKAIRATERETASQQAALLRLKSKQFGGRTASGGAPLPRKVVNYSNGDNFSAT